jgi:hypothetical protein
MSAISSHGKSEYSQVIFVFFVRPEPFASVELTTLFWTWWGIIGFWLGPLYIAHNLVEYIIATFPLRPQ